MFSAKGAPSLLSLGRRPRIKYALEQALKARLNNVGRRNFYFIPAALPQAKIEAAASAPRVVTDRPERLWLQQFQFRRGFRQPRISFVIGRDNLIGISA